MRFREAAEVCWLFCPDRCLDGLGIGLVDCYGEWWFVLWSKLLTCAKYDESLLILLKQLSSSIAPRNVRFRKSR